MRKLFIGILSAVLFTALFTTAAFAKATYIVAGSGTCGDNLTWTLDESGTLTISGSGAMTEWDEMSESPFPWQRKISDSSLEFYPDSVQIIKPELIKSLIIGDNVTSISKGAFKALNSLTTVHIPANIEVIPEGAFQSC